MIYFTSMWLLFAAILRVLQMQMHVHGIYHVRLCHGYVWSPKLYEISAPLPFYLLFVVDLASMLIQQRLQLTRE